MPKKPLDAQRKKRDTTNGRKKPATREPQIEQSNTTEEITMGEQTAVADETGETETAQATFATGPTSASGRIKVAEKEVNEEDGIFSIVFSNGKSAEVDFNALPGNIQKALGLHGLSQKLGDSYASVKGNVDEAMKRFEATVTQLQNGDWKKARESSGEGASKVTELAAAIARFKNAPIEKANAAVAKATPEQKKAWAGNAQIKAIVATIRAERAAERAKLANDQAGQDASEGATDAAIEALEL